MEIHKFMIGQTLTFHPDRLEFEGSKGQFEVTRLLPTDGVERQYRVRNLGTGQERVVRESQLTLD